MLANNKINFPIKFFLHVWKLQYYGCYISLFINFSSVLVDPSGIDKAQDTEFDSAHDKRKHQVCVHVHVYPCYYGLSVVFWLRNMVLLLIWICKIIKSHIALEAKET